MTNPLAPLLPPVTCFLLEQVCLEIGDSHHFPPVPAADLAAEAQRQGITGLLLRWAQANPGNPVAAELAPLLAPKIQANALNALRLLNDTVQVVDLLQAAGIDALVLKGPLLSKRYYGDYGTRGAGDVDVLVAEANAARADRVLREAGHTRIKPQRDLSPRRLALYLDTQHEFGYRPPSGAGLVELHWRFADCRLFSPQDFGELYARSELMPTASRPLRTLCPADTFAQLAIHGAMDGWSRLKWIADLPRVHAAMSPADQDQFRSNGNPAMQLALALAEIGEIGDSHHFSLLRHVAGRLTGKPRGFLSDLRYMQTLAGTPRIRRAMAYANLITPRDFDLLPLPDALTFALPWLAQCRRGLQKLFG